MLSVIACWTLRGPRPRAQVHGSEGALFAMDDGLLLLAADGTDLAGRPARLRFCFRDATVCGVTSAA